MDVQSCPSGLPKLQRANGRRKQMSEGWAEVMKAGGVHRREPGLGPAAVLGGQEQDAMNKLQPCQLGSGG